MQCYRIKNWSRIYENNRTRELKKMQWVPVPVKLDGDGYSNIMQEESGQYRKDGAAIFGAWISCVEVAASCENTAMRGTLIRSSGEPHTPDSLSRITRIPKATIEKMLDFCLNICKWLEIIDLQTGAEIPQEDAEKPHDSAAPVPISSIPSIPSDKTKKKYQTYVMLLEEEYNRMIAEWGKVFADRAIYEYDLKFPNSKTIRAHKDHNRAIRDYVNRGYICQGKIPQPEKKKEKTAELSPEEIGPPEGFDWTKICSTIGKKI
jgi:hypothetical protein